MASLLRLLNRLLPFATPGTPLVQDLVHLGVICAVLYYAPQIQERIQQYRQGEDTIDIPEDGQVEDPVEEGAPHEPEAEQEHLDFGERVQNHEENQDENENAPFHPNGAPLPNGAFNDNPEAGPANPGPAPPQRNVGAKKAKSLARKDRRRAYNEFQRSQGDAQRQREAEEASEREAALAAERERRKAAEAKFAEQKAKEREKKKEAERKEWEEGMMRRERAVEIVKGELEGLRRMCNVFEVLKGVGGDVDDVWLEKLLKSSGILGRGTDGAVTMITSTGWIVRIKKEDMQAAYERVAEGAKGEISSEEIGLALEKVLKEGR